MNVKLFNVSPKIPAELKFLEKLANNLWWCYNPLAVELFVRIDPTLWNKVAGNAKRFLHLVSQERLEELSGDHNYTRMLKMLHAEFEKQVEQQEASIKNRDIAYFSLEFGLHESVPIFSGGLGVLAGDHLKAASDMSLPLVAVGLLYGQGYFRQVLDRNGWQIERYPENEVQYLPLEKAKDPNGNEVIVSVPLKNGELFALVWVLKVGNVPLLLLDAEIPQNPPELRETTWRLYGGDKTTRLHQELLLGIGGIKALLAMGYNPKVFHMNEGHAAFLSLERIADFVRKGYDPDVALEIVWRTNVFTTHTPVPAGNEVFDLELLRPYLEPYAQECRMDVERLIRWGVPIAKRDSANELSMTVMGLRMANYSNGVSKLHGEVAREMWKELWPQRSVSEVPIRHITNGVHIPSWVSARMREIFNRYLNPDWMHNPKKVDELAEDVMNIPDDELWITHELNKQSLIRRAKSIMQNESKVTMPQKVKGTLRSDVLTIGFARRFATYKRGTLLLRDEARLIKLLRDPNRPIQLIFAGKAHPADNEGKKLIQELIQFAERNNVRDRLVFLEDYDISLARSMVKGVDIWLNTPRRPQEASGTSGMKSAVNGVLNCSIRDGWWAEAATPEVGWSIETNANYTDNEDADNFDSQALFALLENEIIPCFYERGDSDIPRKWVAKMKNSIVMALSKFSSARMVEDYKRMFYLPAAKTSDKLIENDCDYAKRLMVQKKKLIENIDKLHIDFPSVSSDMNDIHVGDKFDITVGVYFAGMGPDELKVEAYYGDVDIHGDIITTQVEPMTMLEDFGNGNYKYGCKITCARSGRFGLTARITPVGNEWDNSVPGFMCWPK